MKIISTNLGKSTTIIWKDKEEQTGIYKYPSNTPIILQKEKVKGDTVSNRKVHGGEYKACYLFSKNEYVYWKQLYPKLEWNWGMFGENLTVDELDESIIRIGDIYKIGTALVQVSQPREPCYKLGIRFGDQSIVKQFIDHGKSGTYVRVLKEGKVKIGDAMVLTEQPKNSLTVEQFFKLIFSKEKNKEIVKLAIANEALPEYKRVRLEKYLLNMDKPAPF